MTNNFSLIMKNVSLVSEYYIYIFFKKKIEDKM